MALKVKANHGFNMAVRTPLCFGQLLGMTYEHGSWAKVPGPLGRFPAHDVKRPGAKLDYALGALGTHRS